jgi:hypothetical protein
MPKRSTKIFFLRSNDHQPKIKEFLKEKISYTLLGRNYSTRRTIRHTWHAPTLRTPIEIICTENYTTKHRSYQLRYRVKPHCSIAVTEEYLFR